MADNFLGKLAVATAGAALSLAVMGAQPAGAATITYDFTVGVTSGPLTGNQYSGFFSYDDASTSRGASYFSLILILATSILNSLIPPSKMPFRVKTIPNLICGLMAGRAPVLFL